MRLGIACDISPTPTEIKRRLADTQSDPNLRFRCLYFLFPVNSLSDALWRLGFIPIDLSPIGYRQIRLTLFHLFA